MAQNISDLLVTLKADTAAFERDMERAIGPMSPLAKAGVVAGAAMLAAGAAVAAFGVKGVKEFADFDKGMREVFTLLPGITATAMSEMSSEVLAFSKEFGKLPEEVIPALYQSLSAGIPPDNVFEFMQTATQLAIGGVSDMETAVDALTSVVNAYGEEAITAEQASDFLFTTVKLGKTTIDELASVVGRITPIAAAAGVGFDEVAAAIAAMTAQGLSTDEAGTALRALLTDLIKGGGDVGEVFESVTGQTFPEFIAAGGDLGGALEALKFGADDLGMGMTEVFSNVRSGLAATVLTSESGTEAMRTNLAEMGDSAGATREAFDMMDAGISASWDRLKAGFNVLTINVGDKLAPMFQKGVDFVVTTVMPALETTVVAVFQAIAETAAWLTDKWAEFTSDGDTTFAQVGSIVTAFGGVVAAAFDVAVAAWENVLKPAWEAINPLVSGVMGVLGPLLEGAFGAIEGLLRSLAALLSGDFEGAWEGMRDAVTSITNALVSALDNLFGGLRDTLAGIWHGIRDNATASWSETKTAIITPMQDAWAWLASTWDTIKTWLTDLWNGITATATTAWEDIDNAIRAPIQAAWDWLVSTWEAIKEWLSGLWSDMEGVAAASFGAIRGAITGAFDGLGSYVEGIFAGVVSAIGGIIDGIVERIRSAMASVTALGEAVSDAVSNARSKRDEVNSWFEDRTPDWMQNLPGVRRDAGGMALGGIVTGPMRALIGEAGPEAVIPLERLDRMIHDTSGGGDISVYVELDGRTLASAVAPRMVDSLRLRTGLSGL